MDARALTLALLAFGAAAADAAQVVTVSGRCNPFLAGQPVGATAHYDFAPAQSPLGIALSGQPGLILTFPSVFGLTSQNSTYGPWYWPDGGPLQTSVSALGISGYAMPLGALLGVFLPDVVNSAGAPTPLDFSSPGSRDFATLAPQLYQVFFIGDGLRADGSTLQSFAAPLGATRLYLGVCDGVGWNDNSGGITVTIDGLAPIACAVVPYCTPKVNSLGCTPTIEATSGLSVSGPDECHVVAEQVCNYRAGLLMWGVAPDATPFQGGLLCVAPPRHRTPLQDSGGNPGTSDCSGSYSFLLSHEFIRSHSLLIGETVFTQYWSRDPDSAPFPSGLTAGLALTICP